MHVTGELPQRSLKPRLQWRSGKKINTFPGREAKSSAYATCHCTCTKFGCHTGSVKGSFPAPNFRPERRESQEREGGTDTRKFHWLGGANDDTAERISMEGYREKAEVGNTKSGTFSIE